MMKKILIFVCLALLLYTLPATASSDPNQDFNSSGKIEFQLSESASYTSSWIDTPRELYVLHPYRLHHRFTDAQYLYTVGFQNELFRINSAIPVNIQSSFTATVDGKYYGSGQIVLSDRYQDNRVALYYYFSDINSTYAETLIGDKDIYITTDLDFASNVVSRAVQKREVNAPTSAQPTQAHAATHPNFNSATGYRMGDVHVITSFGKIYQNSYLYSYNANTKLFTINVDRSTSASKIHIYDASGTDYVNENLYSNAHFDFVKPLLNGVILDVTWDFDGGTTRSKTIHLASTTQSGGSTPMHSIAWGKSSYSTGETASISYNIDNPDAGTYLYKIRIGDAQNIKRTDNLGTASGTYSYTFPSNSITSTWIAQILATNIATNQTTILATAGTKFTGQDIYSISWSEDVYAYGDTMQISYSNLPTNTLIYVEGSKYVTNPAGYRDTEVVYTNSYTRTGSGTITFTTPSSTATNYMVLANYNNYTLGRDYCQVAAGENMVYLTGVVRDAETGARIEGAFVTLDNLGPYTNELGAYSILKQKGVYELDVSADGYRSYRQSISLYSNTVNDVYLSPAQFEGNLYGTITDYRTGSALSGVLVTVKNSTATKTTFTSSTGFYSINGMVNGTVYSVTATLDGYDPYANKSVTMDQVTWIDIKLVPKGYTGPGSGTDTGTTGERPGRAAARNSLAELELTVPGLIVFIVFVVFLTVMKKM